MTVKQVSVFTTRPASWNKDKHALMQVRHAVFIEEQRVPASLESDDFDPISLYILAESLKALPIGCARLQPNGKVTRIAVLREYRRLGIAQQMLSDIITIAESKNLSSLYLHAQLEAVDLYKKFGFAQDGEQFEEAGIQHIKMVRSPV